MLFPSSSQLPRFLLDEDYNRIASCVSVASIIRSDFLPFNIFVSKPHLRKYKHRSSQNFNELAMILGNDYAIGVGARTSIEVDMDMTNVDNEAPRDEGLEAFPDETDFQIPHSTSPSQSQQNQPSGSRRRRRTLHVDPEIAQIFGTMSNSLTNLANVVQQRGRVRQQEFSDITN